MRRLSTAVITLGLVGLGTLTLPQAVMIATTRRDIVGLDELRPVPAALVLGAHVNSDGTPSNFLQGRLDRAIEVYRAGKAGRLIVSGGTTSPSYDEPAAMRHYLQQHGVPATAISNDSAGWDTYDSCLRARDIFGLDAVIVISQTFHLPRALTICRAIGLPAQGYPDHGVRESTPGSWAHNRIRECFASLKMVKDLVTRRWPLGQR